MSDTFTATLNLTKPALDASRDTWGQKLNANFDAIDAAIAEILATDIPGISDDIAAAITAALPAGIVVMWSGSHAAVPAGWSLCDGTNGTPDLRDKFILGAHSGRNVGDAGGAFSYSVATSAEGFHAHHGAVGGTAITEAQMPNHQHGGITDVQGHHDHALPMSEVTWGFSGGAASMLQRTGLNGGVRTEAGGSHSHNIATDFRGGNQPHTHSINGDGQHSHAVTIPNVPPYYALAFIRRN